MARRIGICIVNYRTPQLTIDNLRSLQSEVVAIGSAKVIVVDNCSGDGSAALIQAAIDRNGWGSWACVRELPRNGGYSYGNNACLREFLAAPDKPEFCLLLNPDTLVRPGAIAALVEFMDGHPDAGILGSRLEDPDGTPQRSAFRFHSILGELDARIRLGIFTRALKSYVMNPALSDVPRRADWVAGASMLVRSSVFEEVGLLDEGYFLYFEEVDFCLRAYRAGWSCWYVPQSRVVHLVGQSTGVTNPKTSRNRLPSYWFDSRRRYFIKNYGPLYTLVIDCVWFVGQVLWEARRLLQRRPRVDPAAMFIDYARNSVFRRGFRL
jgi:N-acetylglucosaminyl-diphospho-decaprenol L-rhamnosyltransferase